MRVWGLTLVLVASHAWADAPKTSIHPAPRPIAVQPTTVAEPDPTAILNPTVPHPRLRPIGLMSATVQPAAQSIVPYVIVRPKPRPAITAVAMASNVPTARVDTGKKAKAATKGMKGAVCGDPDIRGMVLPPIGSKGKGCGIAEPVKVASIAGVGFSQPATIDCATAKALKSWMIKGMQPAFGSQKVVKLHIFGSYSCRSRNNVKGAKISEHGHGKAIDIAGFIFANGKELTVERDYNRTIKKAQKAACGIFGTTLGPGSDGYHENHLHFDTASYRKGSYCR